MQSTSTDSYTADFAIRIQYLTKEFAVPFACRQVTAIAQYTPRVGAIRGSSNHCGPESASG